MLVRGALRRGRPWEEVIALAVDMRADLVVLGTHGRRGLPRAILGSVAERVVRLWTHGLLACLQGKSLLVVVLGVPSNDSMA
jgi:hypothetical protein